MVQPNTNSTSSGVVAKTALVAVGATVTGIAAYCAYKKYAKQNEELSLELAMKKKEEGIECFRNRKYTEAIKFFKESIAFAKKLTADEAVKSLIANCNNNLSASCESLNDIRSAIDYCNAAIEIDPKYVKALRRRARLYEKNREYIPAIQDYFTLTPLCTTQPDIVNLHNDVDRIVQLAVQPEVEELLRASRTSFKNIPQHRIAVWLWNSVINDPIAKRIEQLKKQKADGIEPVSSLDQALMRINEGRYNEVIMNVLYVFSDKREKMDKVLSTATPLKNKEENGEVHENGEVRLETDANGCVETDAKVSSPTAENGSYDTWADLDTDDGVLWEYNFCLLLAARFYHFHNQKAEVENFMDKFDHCWDTTGDLMTPNRDWTDLRVAYHALQVEVAETDRDVLQAIEDAVTIAPTNTDPLMALVMRHFDNGRLEDALDILKHVIDLNPDHPYAHYYICYLDYVIALKAQAIDRVRSQIYNFDQKLRMADDPPVFAQLLFAKVCMSSDNSQLALVTLKKVLEKMPDNAYARYLCGIMEDAPMLSPQEGPQRIRDYVIRVEKAMQKVLEIDFFYWEPYRTLAKIALDKMEFPKAMNLYAEAINLARSRDDLEMLAKDRLMARLMWDRVKSGHGLPFMVPDTYIQRAE